MTCFVWPFLLISGVVADAAAVSYVASFTRDRAAQPLLSRAIGSTSTFWETFDPAWVDDNNKTVRSGLLVRTGLCQVSPSTSCLMGCRDGTTGRYSFSQDISADSTQFGGLQEAFVPEDTILEEDFRLSSALSLIFDPSFSKYYGVFGCSWTSTDTGDTIHALCAVSSSNPTAPGSWIYAEDILGYTDSPQTLVAAFGHGRPNNILLWGDGSDIQYCTSRTYISGWTNCARLMEKRDSVEEESEALYPAVRPLLLRATGEYLVIYTGVANASTSTSAMWAIVAFGSRPTVLSVTYRADAPLVVAQTDYEKGVGNFSCVMPNSVSMRAAYEIPGRPLTFRVFYGAAGAHIAGGIVSIWPRWNGAVAPSSDSAFSIVVSMRFAAANGTTVTAETAVSLLALITLLLGDNSTLVHETRFSGAAAVEFFAVADLRAYDILVVAVNSPNSDIRLSPLAFFIDIGYGVRWEKNYTRPLPGNSNDNTATIVAAVVVPSVVLIAAVSAAGIILLKRKRGKLLMDEEPPAVPPSWLQSTAAGSRESRAINKGVDLASTSDTSGSGVPKIPESCVENAHDGVDAMVMSQSMAPPPLAASATGRTNLGDLQRQVAPYSISMDSSVPASWTSE